MPPRRLHSFACIPLPRPRSVRWGAGSPPMGPFGAQPTGSRQRRDHALVDHRTPLPREFWEQLPQKADVELYEMIMAPCGEGCIQAGCISRPSRRVPWL